jgi:hypothetical protein
MIPKSGYRFSEKIMFYRALMDVLARLFRTIEQGQHEIEIGDDSSYPHCDQAAERRRRLRFAFENPDKDHTRNSK